MGKTIAITCGDPSGLGPETIENCLSEIRFADTQFRVFGNGAWLDVLKEKTINAIEGISLSEDTFELGKPMPQGARLAMAAMEAAAKDCLEGRSDAVVTGPISKELCAKEGYRFPGQTEFFADRWGGEPTMAFVGERLKVCLATWHIPLKEVALSLTESVFKKSLHSAIELTRRLGDDRGRILVCGLNPHAGENGVLGNEERDSLNVWVEELKREYPFIEGCIPGDTAFARAMKGEGEVVVAMYHDQGLAPFKAVDFDSGVNVTMGLPYLRVSPDHGTGFGIAGKGLASHGSLLAAIRLALQWRD